MPKKLTPLTACHFGRVPASCAHGIKLQTSLGQLDCTTGDRQPGRPARDNHVTWHGNGDGAAVCRRTIVPHNHNLLVRGCPPHHLGSEWQPDRGSGACAGGHAMSGLSGTEPAAGCRRADRHRVANAVEICPISAIDRRATYRRSPTARALRPRSADFVLTSDTRSNARRTLLVRAHTCGLKHRMKAKCGM